MRAMYSGDLGGEGLGGGCQRVVPWSRALSVYCWASLGEASVVRARRERVMRVEWVIGSEADLGRGCEEVDSREREDRGSEEMMERCWGVAVRSTMLDYRGTNPLNRLSCGAKGSVRVEDWLYCGALHSIQPRKRGVTRSGTIFKIATSTKISM